MRKIGSADEEKKEHNISANSKKKKRQNTSVRTIVNQRCDQLCFWPFRFSIKLFSILIPSTLISNCDFGQVVVQDSLMKMYDELDR
jgi:hypothetical protein